jgi:hypothetical protein
MKESGLMIKLMDLEHISILMELYMKGIGKMIYNMAKDTRDGQIILLI